MIDPETGRSDLMTFGRALIGRGASSVVELSGASYYDMMIAGIAVALVGFCNKGNETTASEFIEAIRELTIDLLPQKYSSDGEKYKVEELLGYMNENLCRSEQGSVGASSSIK